MKDYEAALDEDEFPNEPVGTKTEGGLMNDDDKKAYREHEARQKAIYERAHMEVLQKLGARFEAIIRQYDELVKDYEAALDEDDYHIFMFNLVRLEHQMAITKEVVVGRNFQLQVLNLDEQYYDHPTEKNMLLATIARLEESCRTAGLEESSNTIDIDRKLLLFLQKSLKKWEKPKNAQSPKTSDLVAAAFEYAQKTGLSSKNAAGKIAKMAGAPWRKGRIANVMSEIKKENDFRSAEAFEDFAPYAKNDPQK